MACSDQFFTCDTIKGKSPEDVLRMLVKVDSNGCPALNTKIVIGASNACTTFVTCPTQDLTWQDLIMLLIGTDDNGCPAVRVIDAP